VTAKRSIRLAFCLALAIMLLWLILSQIKLKDIKRAIDDDDPRSIIADLAAFACRYASRVQRSRLILKRDNPTLKWSDCAGPFAWAGDAVLIAAAVQSRVTAVPHFFALLGWSLRCLALPVGTIGHADSEYPQHI
jgi:hypothetical protein